MATQLLMPKATAVWLVENTALSFTQIADFCTLHPLEVQAIADGDVSGGIKGVSPIQNGQLSREEISKAEADENHRLKLSEPKVKVAAPKRRGPRYTPTSRRHERPNAIKWLIRNHPELKDAQIMRLVGTTKNTIESIRDGSHWNTANLTPMDPVTLGLASQIELDMEVRRAARAAGIEETQQVGTRLMTAEEALSRAHHAPSREEDVFAPSEPSNNTEEREAQAEADSVFAKLNSLKGKYQSDED